VIAVETNILVAALRPDAANHEKAARAVQRLVDSDDPWAIPWPCVHELIAVTSNPRVFSLPTPVAIVCDQIDELMEGGALLLNESRQHLITLRDLALDGAVVGGQIHDARIAAICTDHGVSELWTADRDFRKFPALATVNPLA